MSQAAAIAKEFSGSVRNLECEVNSDDSLNALWNDFVPMYQASGHVYVFMSTEKQEVEDKKKNKYTQKQRGALHVWCEQCAQVLNNAGLQLSVVKMFSQGATVEVDWNLILFKERIYKPMLDVLTGKKSTEDQSSVDPSDVAVHIIRHFGSNGVTMPAWPSLR